MDDSPKLNTVLSYKKVKKGLWPFRKTVLVPYCKFNRGGDTVRCLCPLCLVGCGYDRLVENRIVKTEHLAVCSTCNTEFVSIGVRRLNNG